MTHFHKIIHKVFAMQRFPFLGVNKQRWALASGLAAGPVLAHHPMGGTVPGTLMEGLLSGFGHPVIEIDHLLFVLAAGFAAALARMAPGRAAALLFGYAAAGSLGTAWQAHGNALAGAELAVPATLLVVALWAWTQRLPGLVAGMVASAAAGVVHGYAYGEAVIGAEVTPLASYLCGLAMVQALMMLGVFFTARRLIPLVPQPHVASAARGVSALLGAAGLWMLWGAA